MNEQNGLSAFVQRNKKFLKLGDEESITVTYMGFVVGVNPQDPEKEKVTYKLKPDGYDKPLFLSSASTSLAERMAKLSIGEVIQLTRHGLEKATTYEINPV